LWQENTGELDEARKILGIQQLSRNADSPAKRSRTTDRLRVQSSFCHAKSRHRDAMRNTGALLRIHTVYVAGRAMPVLRPVETEARRIAHGLRRKDLALITELVERYQHRLVRYVLYLTGRGEYVEDLVQETWLRVLERAAQYDGRSRFEPWLFAIARHLAIDDLRRRPVVSLDTDATDVERVLPGGLSSHASPFLAAARGEDAVRLATALDLLEPIYREALLLRFHEDLSLQEIATVVGAPVPTVSSRIHRGLARLRSLWTGDTNAV
jgi:RNA polymerase sigma-70 factor (ECF subfamily)